VTERDEQLRELGDALAVEAAKVERLEGERGCGEGSVLRLGFAAFEEGEALPEGFAFSRRHVDVSLDAGRHRKLAAVLRGMIDTEMTVLRHTRGGTGGVEYPVRTPQDALCVLLDLIELVG